MQIFVLIFLLNALSREPVRQVGNAGTSRPCEFSFPTTDVAFRNLPREQTYADWCVSTFVDSLTSAGMEGILHIVANRSVLHAVNDIAKALDNKDALDEIESGLQGTAKLNGKKTFSEAIVDAYLVDTKRYQASRVFTERLKKQAYSFSRVPSSRFQAEVLYAALARIESDQNRKIALWKMVVSLETNQGTSVGMVSVDKLCHVYRAKGQVAAAKALALRSVPKYVQFRIVQPIR